jgi:hypothetical protein
MIEVVGSTTSDSAAMGSYGSSAGYAHFHGRSESTSYHRTRLSVGELGAPAWRNKVGPSCLGRFLAMSWDGIEWGLQCCGETILKWCCTETDSHAKG